MPKLNLSTRQELRIAPALLTHARLLELTVVDLHEAIREELVANPALEELEVFASRASAPDHAGARLLRVAAPISLADALLADLRMSLPASDHAVAALVVGSLDGHGFLPEAVASLARSAGVERARIDVVLRALRAIGPPGIATRGARESLLAQLDELAATGEPRHLARAVVAEHLDDLGAGRYRAIARALGVGAEDVAAAHEFIRRRLWPYPNEAAHGVPTEPDRRMYRAPDLIFRTAGDGFNVELAAAPGRMLQLNPVYAELVEREGELLEGEREHVRTYVERAKVFLRSLHRRGETLQRVGAALAGRQEQFLRDGPQALVPLTRLQLADGLKLHESTVCRAIADKTAQLPNGGLWPLDGFFDASRPARELVRALVEGEITPLSDQQLATMLAERGHPIARRTVAKYRDELGIAPQSKRARR